MASFLIIPTRFLGRLILCILVLAFAFVLAVYALAFALAGLALAFAPHTHTGHRLAVSVLLCSRDLKDFLSHLCPARDPCAVLDEVRFPQARLLRRRQGILEENASTLLDLQSFQTPCKLQMTFALLPQFVWLGVLQSREKDWHMGL